MLLLGLVAFAVIGFLIRRFKGRSLTSNSPAFAGAQHGFQPDAGTNANHGSWNANLLNKQANTPEIFKAETRGEPFSSVSQAARSDSGFMGQVPAGFDAAGFERVVKLIFIRMQAAHDKADLSDLRQFTTPEMFAEVKLELQSRGATTQQTDVVKIEAQVLDVAQEVERQIVSVRFHGLIREDLDGAANDFDEVWHLVKPASSDQQHWLIAGIEQRS